MKNILFVGENPKGMTGNSAMMAALLEQLDYETYRPVCFSSFIPHYYTDIFSSPPTYDIITASETTRDFGSGNLIDLIKFNIKDLDALVVVGVDIWRYAPAIRHIWQLSQTNKFKTICILPYDVPSVREDWAMWFSTFDFPYVYSEFGYNVLKPHVPALRYFRPPLHKSDLFTTLDEEKRVEVRRKYFSQMGKDRFLFGFIGANQFRKDPQRALKAFFELKKTLPNISLYLHTNMQVGVFNLEQIAHDYALQYGAKTGDILSKKQNYYYDREAMVGIYNGIDCLLNTSVHEGLSWTLLEAMLCGTPVVASNNTAQVELLKDGGGYPVECSDIGYIPVVTASGRSFVETRSCDLDDLVKGMHKVATEGEYRREIVAKGRETANEWLKGVSDINELLKEACFPEYIAIGEERKQAILFVQHSSAGDVLMSTQCLRGLKERHPGLPLVYMTQKQYQDIVTGNPYVDEVVDYNEAEFRSYKVVYNPHGDRILSGGFNNLDTRLHDMYPYFCDVEADDMYIECVEPVMEHTTIVGGEKVVDLQIPKLKLPPEYIVIQSAGGQKQYRTYRHSDLVIQMLPDEYFVQLGSGMDMACLKAHLDLREKLSWRESAWVMKNAKAAVVIDSFLSHLAGTLGTPAVVLFGPAPARVTGPKGDPNKLKFLEPNKLDVCPNLTSCWGQPGMNQCNSPCINTIHPMLVVRALQELLQPKEAFGV